MIPLKRLATLQTAQSRTDPGAVIRLESVESGTGHLVTDLGSSPSALPGAGLADVSRGDVLFGKLRPYLAKIVHVRLPAYASTELMCLRPAADVDSRWLFYRMLSLPTIDWAVATSDGSKMPRTSWDRLGEFEVTTYDIDAQRAIADYLDAETTRIDSVIALKRSLVERLAQREDVIRDRLFGTDHQLSSDAVPIGVGGAETIRLGHLARVQTGLTLDAGRVVPASEPEVAYLRVANVQDGRLDLSEVKTVAIPAALLRRCSLRAGDVLMTEGGDPDKLGRGTVWRGEIDECLHQNHVFAVRPDLTRLLPDYLALLTRTSYARRYFEVTCSKTTGIASTSSSKIAAFRVPLPSIEEQARTVRAYDASRLQHDAVRHRLTTQLRLIQEHRQALITAAVIGELDIPGAA